MINVAILGVSGRMGRCLVRTVREAQDLSLSGALASDSSPTLGRDAGDVAETGPVGVAVTADRAAALDGADVAIDFTLPAAAMANLEAAAARGVPMVIGTTGLDETCHAAIRRLSHDLPVLVAPNMSLGVNLLFSLVAKASAALGDDYDIEILDAHHRNKVDAPSGTALRIAEIAAGARGRGPVYAGRPDRAATAGGDRLCRHAGRRHRGRTPRAVCRDRGEPRNLAPGQRQDDFRLWRGSGGALDHRAAARRLRHGRRPRRLTSRAPLVGRRRCFMDTPGHRPVQFEFRLGPHQFGNSQREEPVHGAPR
jgi:4-hydroxy-tetrahydrodipicolinate reductase